MRRFSVVDSALAARPFDLRDGRHQGIFLIMVDAKSVIPWARVPKDTAMSQICHVRLPARPPVSGLSLLEPFL